ncbi:uncharacterized protein [Dendrobates tinctorius]|uniref:uncharacterized protein n=1 Tax=Dendrobates tinctorius TaxID=92724 RepID=UPI003CC9D27B
MELLAAQNQEIIDALDQEIEGIQKKLKQEISDGDLETINQEIDNEFQKWEKEIYANKTSKFQRDTSDKQSNTMYRWNRRSRRARNPPRKRSTSYTSYASSEESSKSMPTKHQPVASLPTRDMQATKRKFTFPNKQDKRDRKNNLEVINLSKHVLTIAQLEVLSKGLTFSPTNLYDSFTAIKDLYLFSRKLVLKKLHTKGNIDQKQLMDVEQEALQALEELLKEQDMLPEVTNVHLTPCPIDDPLTSYYLLLSRVCGHLIKTWHL